MNGGKIEWPDTGMGSGEPDDLNGESGPLPVLGGRHAEPLEEVPPVKYSSNDGPQGDGTNGPLIPGVHTD